MHIYDNKRTNSYKTKTKLLHNGVYLAYTQAKANLTDNLDMHN